MLTVSKTVSFDAAHLLTGHAGQCRNLHGHTYRVTVTLRGAPPLPGQPGDMVTAFNDWCFDESRKSGDTGVVETEYGAHVMYFVGQNLPVWKANVFADLQLADYDEWVASLSADASVTRSFGIRFVG